MTGEACSNQVDDYAFMMSSLVTLELVDACQQAMKFPPSVGPVEDREHIDGDLSDVDTAICKPHSTSWDKIIGRLPAMTQRDLENMAAESIVMTPWPSNQWHCIKTLAPAAGGAGTVDLLMSGSGVGQQVVVKRLPLKIIGSCPDQFDKNHPRARERPWTDIAIMNLLNFLGCPFACKLLGLFLGDDQVSIMTSFANRGDLFHWCSRDTSNVGAPRETVMLPLVSQVFAGVCWLHDLGISHRDLSLENVLLHDDGINGLEVKIIDFGAASLSRSAIFQVRGKRSYQAPEMHGSAEYDTFLADIFSVGVIVYCMAVHYYPWEQTKPGKDRCFAYAQRKGLPIFLCKKRMPCNKMPVAQCFSRHFLELLCGLLALAPEKRYSLGEVCFKNSQRKVANLWAALEEA